MCILSLADGSEGEEEEEALNQLVISFRESYNSASQLSSHGIEFVYGRTKQKRQINRLLAFPSSDCLTRVIVSG